MHSISARTHNWLALKINNDQVRRRLEAMKGTVYDLGCGTRPYEREILRFADRYIGVDWASSIHPLCADTVADLNRPLPIADCVADTVVSFQVLEHLSEPQVMLGEAYRILRPGGHLFLSVPFQWGVHESPHDYFRFTRYGLAHVLSKAGFEQIEVEAVCGFWSTSILRLNYHTLRWVRGPRLLRAAMRRWLIPGWWTGQTLAPHLDRLFPSEEDTGGYFAVARRPLGRAPGS